MQQTGIDGYSRILYLEDLRAKGACSDGRSAFRKSLALKLGFRAPGRKSGVYVTYAWVEFMKDKLSSSDWRWLAHNFLAPSVKEHFYELSSKKWAYPSSMVHHVEEWHIERSAACGRIWALCYVRSYSEGFI